MAAIRALAILLLTGVVVLAHITLAKQAEWNGTVKLDNVLASPTRILPGSDILLSLPSTGIFKVDNYFSFMAAFFHTSLDAKNVRAHWQGNHLLGTLTSIFLVMLTEAHGSTSSLFFLATYFLEVMGELLGIGLFTPIWAITHLVLVRNPTKKTNGPVVSSKGHFKALGYAFVVGHVVPSLFMLRTQPDGEGFLSQPLWSILRLFHPIWVFVAWKVFKVFAGKNTPSGSSQPAIFTKRKFYVFSILASAFFHVTSLAYLLSPYLAANWLEDGVLAALDLKTVLIPLPFWSESIVPKVSFAQGVAIFLQWDYLCASIAIVIWAAALSAEAITATRRLNGASVLETYGQAAGVAILAGPGAAAAFLLQERDAILAAPVELVEEKKRK
jgi:hypothetical protein